MESLLGCKLALIAILIQSLALDIFHGEKRNPIGGHAAAVELRDIRMIKTGQETLFALEVTNDIVRVHSTANELERGFAMQLSILREINFAHSATADERQNFVITNYLSGPVGAGIAHEGFGGKMQGRFFNELIRGLMMFKQRLHFRPQAGVGTTCVVQKRWPFPRIALDRGFNKFGKAFCSLRRGHWINRGLRGSTRIYTEETRLSNL